MAVFSSFSTRAQHELLLF